MPDVNAYGRRLREALQLRGYENADGALDLEGACNTIRARTGRSIAPRTLGRFCRGSLVPKLDEAEAICKGIGVEVLALFIG